MKLTRLKLVGLLWGLSVFPITVSSHPLDPALPQAHLQAAYPATLQVRPGPVVEHETGVQDEVLGSVDLEGDERSQIEPGREIGE